MAGTTDRRKARSPESLIQVTAFTPVLRHSTPDTLHARSPMTGSRREITIMMNDTHTQLRQLSPQDFASFGLGVVADRDLAFAAIIQNDMEPVSVH